MLYFGVGRFISHNSRNGYWGRGAIDTISDHLDRELPGLRGFSARNLLNMRTFYEEWTILDIDQGQANLAVTTAKSNGQVRDYRLKAQGRTALLFQCLKMNMQMTDDRRALG